MVLTLGAVLFWVTALVELLTDQVTMGLLSIYGRGFLRRGAGSAGE